MLEQGYAGATVLPFEERSFASAVPERGVQVAGRPCGTDIVLGHEGERAALHVGDLFRAMLVEGVTVSHLQRFSVTQVDLLLPRRRARPDAAAPSAALPRSALSLPYTHRRRPRQCSATRE